MESLLKILGWLALAVVLAIISGYTASVMWGWFVVPFFGAPVLSIPYAIGITTLLRYVASNDSKKEYSNEEVIHSISMAFAKPCVILAIGYIVKQFI